VDPALSPNTEGPSEGSGSNNNSADQGPLEDLVAEAVPEINVTPGGNGGGGNNGGGLPTNPNPEGAGDEVESGCSAASVGGGAGLGGGLFVLGLLALRRARRRS
jgi:MYXO-CTERM domain-containing protein